MNMVVRQRKLTDDVVRQIRRDVRSIAQLAKVYDLNQVTVWRIKTGRRKAGVPDVAPTAAPGDHDNPQDKEG